MKFLLTLFTLTLVTCDSPPPERCPLDKTTFYITIGIPLVKDINALNNLVSLQCGTLNYCGTGKESITCPVIAETGINGKPLGYDKALNLAIIKSNIPAGSILVQVEFGDNKTAEVTLRYAKYGQNVTETPTDIPRGWDDIEKSDFSAIFPDGNVTFIKATVEVGGVNKTGVKTGVNSQGLREEATLHGTRVSEWFKLILGAKGVNGTVTAVKKKDDPSSWTVFSDLLTLSFDKDWNRDVFEGAVTKFNAEHFSLCECLLRKRKMLDDQIKANNDPADCLAAERYQKYLSFFDTESSICKNI